MNTLIDKEAMYARGIGLLVNQRDIEVHHIFATEMEAFPPSRFHVDGQMRDDTGKRTLRINIQVEVSERLSISQTAVVMDDMSTVLGILTGSVEMFVSYFKN